MKLSEQLRHAYQRYLDGEITMEELFDISDRLGTRIYEAKDRLLAAKAAGERVGPLQLGPPPTKGHHPVRHA